MYPAPAFSELSFVEKDNDNYLAGVREITVRSEYTDGRDMPRLLVSSVELFVLRLEVVGDICHGHGIKISERLLLKGNATRNDV